MEGVLRVGGMGEDGKPRDMSLRLSGRQEAEYFQDPSNRVYCTAGQSLVCRYV